MKDNPHTEYVRMSRVDLLREALELRHRIAGQERENAELREKMRELESAQEESWVDLRARNDEVNGALQLILQDSKDHSLSLPEAYQQMVIRAETALSQADAQAKQGGAKRSEEEE